MIERIMWILEERTIQAEERITGEAGGVSTFGCSENHQEARRLE